MYGMDFAQSSWHDIKRPHTPRHMELYVVQRVILACTGDMLKDLQLLTHTEAGFGHCSKDDDKLLDISAFFPSLYMCIFP